MGEIIEIRWHGRGGQGAKTAALLLADAALGEGKHIQAFPEYGPERMGAPVQAFNRISEEPIRLHCQVTNPSIVVVLDTTLAGTVDVVAGSLPSFFTSSTRSWGAPMFLASVINSSIGIF
jgi:pyruvate ferredoxin oxidoreductase gamma subunit